MPIEILAQTTQPDSKAARLLRVQKLIKGELKGVLPVGTHAVVVKTASLYYNPATGKTSYRCDVEVVEGEYAGCQTLVFTSASDDNRIAEMAGTLGLTSDAEINMLLDPDPAVFKAMQGKRVGIVRELKDGSTSKLTNNWAPRA